MPTARDDDKTVPVIEERVVVERRARKSSVRVTTEVDQSVQTIELSSAVEEVEVEQVELDRLVDKRAPVRQEGDTLIVPLHSEEAVVVRRLKVIGEVRITKRRSTRQREEQVTLRRERPVIERFDGASGLPEKPV